MGIKKICLIIPLAIITFILCQGTAMAAPSSYRMDRVDSPTMLAGIRIGYKFAQGKEVYCLSYAKQTPKTGCTFNRTNYYIDDPGVTYILDYNVKNNQSARWKYHVKEATLYRYLYDNRGNSIIKSTNGNKYTPNQIGLKQYTNINGSIWNRVANATNGLNNTILTNARNATYKTSGVDASVKVSAATEDATCEFLDGNRNVVSPQITVKGNGVDLNNANISLGDNNARVVNKVVSKNGKTMTFNVAYPSDMLPEDGKDLNIRVTATSTKEVNRYYVYTPGSGCESNTQETIIMVPDKEPIETSASVKVHFDPKVCDRYDFRPDSLCLNCDETDANWSFIYSDMANWEGIGKSFKYKDSKIVQKYFREGNIDGNTVACREQIRVKFPDEGNAIQVQTGRYFTVGLPQQYSIDAPNFEPLKVERTKECHAFNSNGDDVTDSVNWSAFWPNDKFYKNATSDDKVKRAESTGEIILNYTELNGEKNYNGEKATDAYNTKVEPTDANTNSLKVTNSYTLTANTYRYIRKDNGLSVSEIPEDVSYDDVGIANFPISFNNTDDDENGKSSASTLQFDYKIPKDSHLANVINDSDYFEGDVLQSNDEDIYKIGASEGAISKNNDTIKKGSLDDNQFNDLKHTACALEYCSDSDLNSNSTEFSCAGFGACVADKIDDGKTQKDCSAADGYICNIDFGEEDDNVCRQEGNKYYIGEDEVSKEEYDEVCSCKIENGKYYINMEEVSQAEYEAVCPPSERVCPDNDPCCLGYCEGGINVIYRTIDLNTPFPGYSAEKRDTGANWCYYNVAKKSLECGSGTYSSQTANQVVNQVIYDNRAVKGNPEYEYNEEPIYEFEMDAAKIQDIRDYNADNEYSDFTLKCDSKTGTKCKLDSRIKRILELDGVCVNATGDSFYTCDE